MPRKCEGDQGGLSLCDRGGGRGTREAGNTAHHGVVGERGTGGGWLDLQQVRVLLRVGVVLFKALL